MLTGRLPYSGSIEQVLKAKRESDPAPPSSFCDVPKELEELCLGLLQRDASKRPGYKTIIETIGFDTAANASISGSSKKQKLFGRILESETLDAAYRRSQAGEAVCVRIEGLSGSGKTTLVESFIEQRVGNNFLVFTGCCYERELVPFKAFDEIVDSISRYLAALSDADVAGLLPRDISALAKLFPVLRQVRRIDLAPIETPTDIRETRTRGLSALREMFQRIGDRKTVVLFVDDLQWGDTDSIVLLEEILRPPDPPSIMVILCYRSEDVETDCIREIYRLTANPQTHAVTDIKLGPLSFEESRSFAMERLHGIGVALGPAAERIARESAGNPYFIAELVETSQSDRNVGMTSSLESLLWQRVVSLSDTSRRLIEIVATAGRPIPADIAYKAAGSRANLKQLWASRFLRGLASNGEELIATYHDRIREIVTKNLQPDVKRRNHLAIARAATGHNKLDHEFLAHHFREAGESSLAADHYREAADNAFAATAFSQAARLYRHARELATWSAEELIELQICEANSLANSGRGAEAAKAFLSLAETEASDSIKWRRQAAEQFLSSGHLEDGMRAFHEVISAVGLKFPKTPMRAILSLLMQRMQLNLARLWSRNGKYLGEKSRAQRLIRIDVCWSAATSLSVIDPIRGAYYQTKGLALALSTDDPLRVARSLALDAAHASITGPSCDAKTEKMLNESAIAASRCEDPYASAIVMLARGMREFLAGRFRSSFQLLASVESTFLELSRRANWELDTCRSWALLCQVFLGNWSDIHARLPALLVDARDRGDLYAEVYLSTFIQTTSLLAKDQPDQALREVESALSRWSPEGFHVQDHNALVATSLIHLYNRNGAKAWETVNDQEHLYRKSMLWRAQQPRIDFLQLRCRSALAAAGQTSSQSAMLASAQKDADRLMKEDAAWGSALGTFFKAAIVDACSDDATALYASALSKLIDVELAAFAATAQYRLGELTGGESGEMHCDQAVSWFSKQGVVDPVAMVRCHNPVG